MSRQQVEATLHVSRTGNVCDLLGAPAERYKDFFHLLQSRFVFPPGEGNIAIDQGARCFERTLWPDRSAPKRRRFPARLRSNRGRFNCSPRMAVL